MVGQRQDDDDDNAETFPCQRVLSSSPVCSAFLFVLPFSSSLSLLFPSSSSSYRGLLCGWGGGYTWRCSIRDRRVEEMAETSPRQVERAAIGAGKWGSPRATARLSVLTIGTASRLPHPAPPMALSRSSAHLSPPLGRTVLARGAPEMQ